MKGEITKEWIHHNLTHNPDYIMSQLPPTLRQMIENGTIPEEIEQNILSGDYSPIEIKQMLNDSEEFFNAILPEKVMQALGVNMIIFT